MPAANAGDLIVAYPDLITGAIKLLAGAVSALGAALVSTFLYIWHQTKGKLDNLDNKVDLIAVSLVELAGKTTTDICKINTRCDERHTERRRVTDT